MGKEGVHNLKSEAEFDEAVAENKASNSLMVVDFFATWCGPCKVIAPQIVKFSDKYTDVKFFKIDVDEVQAASDATASSGPGLMEKYDVRAMPTFLLLKGDTEVAKVVGANPAAVDSAIKKNL